MSKFSGTLSFIDTDQFDTHIRNIIHLEGVENGAAWNNAEVQIRLTEGTKAYGEFGIYGSDLGLSITAICAGTAQNNNYVSTTNHDTEIGAEWAEWILNVGSKRYLKIHMNDESTVESIVARCASNYTGTPWGIIGFGTGSGWSGMIDKPLYLLDNYNSGSDGTPLGFERQTWTANKVIFDIAAGSSPAQMVSASGGVTGTPWAVLTPDNTNNELQLNYDFVVSDLGDYVPGEGGGSEAPVITPGNSFFNDSLSVSISCSNLDAEIFYTLDGTDPTDASILYDSPITIFDTSKIRAVSKLSGTYSSIVQCIYTLLPDLSIANTGNDALLVVDDNGDIDIQIKGGDIVLDSSLRTSIIISLFSDAQAEESELLPEHSGDRRGWWADATLENSEDSIGSLLWLLERSKITGDAMAKIVDKCKISLAWMIEDGVASEIDAEVVRSGTNAGTITIKITKPGKVLDKYSFAWISQEGKYAIQ